MNHSGSTHTNPCAMPTEYLAELKHKVRPFKSFRPSVTTTHTLSDTQVTAAFTSCNVLKQGAQSTGSKGEMAKELTESFKAWLQV